ncbi:uncharacterized protein [Symphalangus syndactylus]|uniref:uncharacterized protein isoform X5 n=1 Tax=Symphalangus syndactylus TaxID=9590 RepID=UPI0030054F3F
MARDTNKGTRFHSADSNHSGSNSTSPPSVSKVTTQHVVGSFAQARRAFKPSPTRRGPALSLSLPVIWRERPVRAGAVGGPGRAVPGVTLRCASFHNYWQWFNGFICFEQFLPYHEEKSKRLHRGRKQTQTGNIPEEKVPPRSGHAPGCFLATSSLQNL